MCGRGHLVLRRPCPGSSPRRLTLRIGWARKALSTSHLQIPLPELGDFAARPSLLGRLTLRRRKPAVGNTVLRPGHTKLLWAVDPGQTHAGAGPTLATVPGHPPRPRAPSSQTTAQSELEGGRAPQLLPARACACLSPPLGFYRILPRGSFLRGFSPLAV